MKKSLTMFFILLSVSLLAQDTKFGVKIGTTNYIADF